MRPLLICLRVKENVKPSIPEEAELGQKVMQVNNSVKQRKTSRIAARTDAARQHTAKSDDFKPMGGF